MNAKISVKNIMAEMNRDYVMEVKIDTSKHGFGQLNVIMGILTFQTD